MLSNLPAHGKISHQMTRNAALNEPRRIGSFWAPGSQEQRSRGVTVSAILLPHERAVFRYDSSIRDQQASPRNYAAVIKIIIADHLELSPVSAAHVFISDLLCLGVFVQFLLAIFQTNSHIRGPFDPPKKIEVITETLPLIEPGHCAVKTVLPLKNDRRILKRGSFLVRRI